MGFTSARCRACELPIVADAREMPPSLQWMKDAVELYESDGGIVKERVRGRYDGYWRIEGRELLDSACLFHDSCYTALGTDVARAGFGPSTYDPYQGFLFPDDAFVGFEDPAKEPRQAARALFGSGLADLACQLEVALERWRGLQETTPNPVAARMLQDSQGRLDDVRARVAAFSVEEHFHSFYAELVRETGDLR